MAATSTTTPYLLNKGELLSTANETTSTMERTFYKLNIEGIVYLVDPQSSKAYLYDLSDLTEIGKVIWTDSKQDPKMELLSNWSEILAAKLELSRKVTVA